MRVKDHYLYNEPEQLSFDFGVIDNRKDNKSKTPKEQHFEAKERVSKDRVEDL